MSWVFCTSGAAIAKAGKRANSVIIASGSTLAAWSDEIEDTICATLKYDAITNYNSLTSSGKKLFGRIASSYVAQKIVGYDVNAYSRSREAETILDVCENDVEAGLEICADNDKRAYLGIRATN